MDDPRLRVEVVSAPAVADRLRTLDVTGLVTVLDRPGPAALVVGGVEDARADVVADDPDALWSGRVEPFARRFAGIDPPPRTPPAPADHDPRLPAAARRLPDRLRAHLAEPSWSYEHIGSSAVPGLRAKRFVDLQLGVTALPDPADLDPRLAALGFRVATGSRPDSPGETHDWRSDPDVPAELYRKRLYFRPDPAEPAILHVRSFGNPWHGATIRFRDRLRADPALHEAY
ncbi:GrpB family protein [Actinosynnema sp. NPDC091369]